MNETINADTKWPCPFSTEELVILRKFWQVCDDISTCRFIRDLPKQEHVVTIQNLPDGSSRCTYPTYDKDDFLAFLTHFRKLVAQRESTNLLRVLNIIGKSAHAQERAALKEIRKNLDAEANMPALQMAIGSPGNENTYTPKQIENIVFNGQVFHGDDTLQADLRRLVDFDPFTKMAFLRYATIVAQQAQQISFVLKKRGYL